METVPPFVYLRGSLVNRAEMSRARASTQLEDAVKISDQKSIIQVLIRSFSTDRFHRFLEDETVETVNFKLMPAALMLSQIKPNCGVFSHVQGRLL